LRSSTATIVAAGMALSRVKTIQVKTETKHKLEMLGRKGDTYDDIIRKLIHNYSNGRKLDAI
jgi:hypothetical protein